MKLNRSRCYLDANSSLRWLFDMDIFLHRPAFLLDNTVCDIPESFLSYTGVFSPREQKWCFMGCIL